MAYRFTKERQDYSDFASGRVFYSFPGRTAFPVRLASEIFQWCLEIRTRQGGSGTCVLYDPCCGSAALLSTLAYLHWFALDQVIGSDIDTEALLLARRNLSLLTLAGMDERIAGIQEMLSRYEKASHRTALASATLLRYRLDELTSTHSVTTRLFAADALQGTDMLKQLGDLKVDIVVTDIPYGKSSSWQFSGASRVSFSNPAWHLLQSLLPVLSPCSIVAIAAQKQQKIAHEEYRRVEHFQVGKRKVVFLVPLRMNQG